MDNLTNVSRSTIGWRRILQILSVSFLKEMWSVLGLKVEQEKSDNIIDTARYCYLSLNGHCNLNLDKRYPEVSSSNVVDIFLSSIEKECGEECRIKIELWAECLIQKTNEFNISHRVICNFFNLLNDNCKDTCIKGIDESLSGKVKSHFKTSFVPNYNKLSDRIDSLENMKKSEKDYEVLEYCEILPVSSATNTLLCVREIILEKYTSLFWKKLREALSHREYQDCVFWYNCENRASGITEELMYEY